MPFYQCGKFVQVKSSGIRQNKISNVRQSKIMNHGALWHNASMHLNRLKCSDHVRMLIIKHQYFHFQLGADEKCIYKCQFGSYVRSICMRAHTLISSQLKLCKLQEEFFFP